MSSPPQRPALEYLPGGHQSRHAWEVGNPRSCSMVVWRDGSWRMNIPGPTPCGTGPRRTIDRQVVDVDAPFVSVLTGRAHPGGGTAHQILQVVRRHRIRCVRGTKWTASAALHVQRGEAPTACTTTRARYRGGPRPTIRAPRSRFAVTKVSASCRCAMCGVLSVTSDAAISAISVNQPLKPAAAVARRLPCRATCTVPGPACGRRRPLMVEFSRLASSTARREIGGFLVVGVLAVVIDFALFNAHWPWTGRCGRPTRWPARLDDVRVRRQLQMDVRPSADQVAAPTARVRRDQCRRRDLHRGGRGRRGGSLGTERPQWLNLVRPPPPPSPQVGRFFRLQESGCSSRSVIPRWRTDPRRTHDHHPPRHFTPHPHQRLR